VKFTITNASEELWPNKVRLSYDTDHETALEIHKAALKIAADVEERRKRAEAQKMRDAMAVAFDKAALYELTKY
jgi:hypothetical protein